MPRYKDISGQEFGRLRAVKRIGTGEYGHVIWLCQCECGDTKKVTYSHLVNGDTKSCGCLRREEAKKKFTKHGGWANGEPSRLWSIWHDIRQRCYNPNREAYRLYGGKGIKVCEEWREGFTKFRKWAKNNGYSEDLTIDRIDGDGDYCPENCRWATRKQQARNRTKGNNFVTYNGETKTIAGWAEKLNLPYYTLYQRLENLGWSVERAFTEKVGAYHQGGNDGN